MPCRKFPVACGTLGLGMIVHPSPFQRSINVSAGDVGVACEFPTAKQLVMLVHDRPTSVFAIAPARFGLATIRQLVPFHHSVSVRTAPCAVT